jgi:tRNA(fMet)-specific endonuclease VapC
MRLLDTNMVIALMNRPQGPERHQYDALRTSGEVIGVSSVVVFELWFGVEKSARRAHNEAALRAFISGPSPVVDFTPSDARAAAVIRADLKREGTPIGPYDILIAGQALSQGATLVTANTAEFGRVNGLVWENWAA